MRSEKKKTQNKKSWVRIKQNIENSYKNFDRNRKRYSKMREMTFITSLDEPQKSVLAMLELPSLEANVLETYVSRLVGEFVKSEPFVKVSSVDEFNNEKNNKTAPENMGINQVPGMTQEGQKKKEISTSKFVEGHLRYAIMEADKDSMQCEIYTEQLSGGYSALKVEVDFDNDRSFEEVIKFRKVWDPTLCGWDPLATQSHKTDGDYCFEITAHRLEDFKKMYPDVDTSEITFSTSKGNTTFSSSDHIGPFVWSFLTGKDKVILLADYYEKKRTKETIVRLAKNEFGLDIITLSEYNELLKWWDDQGILSMPPVIKNKRETVVTKVYRYHIIESGVIKKEETNYSTLPIVFVDGNSVWTRRGINTSVEQFTKPYIMQAIGMQKMKNFAMQRLAGELQDIGPAKVVASLEGIDDDYLDGYINPQKSGTLLYREYLDGDPNKRLTPPRVEQRPQIPPIIGETMVGSDAQIQNILGSFDASMAKMAESEMSGVAYQEMATMSNAASMPYLNNYLKALQCACQIYVDLMPYYYDTPRTMSIISSDGTNSFVEINSENGPSIDYEPNALKVFIEAGPSFSVLQNRALNQIISLSRAIPSFGEFINQAGTDLVLDNVDIRNVEELRERAKTWMQEQKAQAQAASQAAQNQPKIEQQAMQIAAQQVQAEHHAAMSKIQQQAAAEEAKAIVNERQMMLESQKIQLEALKILAEIKNSQAKIGIEEQKAIDNRVTKIADIILEEKRIDNDSNHKDLDRVIGTLHSIADRKAKEEKRGNDTITKMSLNEM